MGRFLSRRFTDKLFHRNRTEHIHHYETQVVHYRPPAMVQRERNLEAQISNLRPQPVQSPEQFKNENRKAWDRLLTGLSQRDMMCKWLGNIFDKHKHNICVVGKTSVGKSTIINKTFDTKLETGVGCTTKVVKVAKQTQNAILYDVPGVNSDWGFFQEACLGFFQKMNKVFILYERDIDDVHMIIQMFVKMELDVEYVRTKCDLWEPGMKSLEDQAQIDLREIQLYDPKATKVILSGKGKNSEISGLIKAEMAKK